MTRFLAPPERIVAALGTLFPGAPETERAASLDAALTLMERAAGGDRVLAIREGTLEWHAIRAMHVGGSEVAALYDVQRPFAMSHFTLWHVKAGRIAPPVVPDEGRPRWGRILEPAIARAAAEEYGWRIEKGGYVIDATTPGMACSLDYIIAEPGPKEIKQGFTGPGVLQIKNSDWLNHKRQWTGGEPPMWILLQLQHESACTGFGWGYIVCLVGGNELERYGYKTRPRVTDDLRERVGGFWQSIAADKPPRIDGSDSSAEAVARLFPTVKAELPLDLIAGNEAPEICAGYLIAQADRRAAERNEQEFRNRLVEKLQGNTAAICQGFRVNVAVTLAKEPRASKPGEVIKGRAESAVTPSARIFGHEHRTASYGGSHGRRHGCAVRRSERPGDPCRRGRPGRGSRCGPDERNRQPGGRPTGGCREAEGSHGAAIKCREPPGRARIQRRLRATASAAAADQARPHAGVSGR